MSATKKPGATQSPGDLERATAGKIIIRTSSEPSAAVAATESPTPEPQARRHSPPPPPASVDAASSSVPTPTEPISLTSATTPEQRVRKVKFADTAERITAAPTVVSPAIASAQTPTKQDSALKEAISQLKTSSLSVSEIAYQSITRPRNRVVESFFLGPTYIDIKEGTEIDVEDVKDFDRYFLGLVHGLKLSEALQQSIIRDYAQHKKPSQKSAHLKKFVEALETMIQEDNPSLYQTIKATRDYQTVLVGLSCITLGWTDPLWNFETNQYERFSGDEILEKTLGMIDSGDLDRDAKISILAQLQSIISTLGIDQLSEQTMPPADLLKLSHSAEILLLACLKGIQSDRAKGHPPLDDSALLMLRSIGAALPTLCTNIPEISQNTKAILETIQSIAPKNAAAAITRVFEAKKAEIARNHHPEAITKATSTNITLSTVADTPKPSPLSKRLRQWVFGKQDESPAVATTASEGAQKRSRVSPDPDPGTRKTSESLEFRASRILEADQDAFGQSSEMSDDASEDENPTPTPGPTKQNASDAMADKLKQLDGRLEGLGMSAAPENPTDGTPARSLTPQKLAEEKHASTIADPKPTSDVAGTQPILDQNEWNHITMKVVKYLNTRDYEPTIEAEGNMSFAKKTQPPTGTLGMQRDEQQQLRMVSSLRPPDHELLLNAFYETGHRHAVLTHSSSPENTAGFLRACKKHHEVHKDMTVELAPEILAELKAANKYQHLIDEYQEVLHKATSKPSKPKR